MLSNVLYRYERARGKTTEIWDILVRGSIAYIYWRKWGKHGEVPGSKCVRLPSESEAKRYALREAVKKEALGYRYVGRPMAVEYVPDTQEEAMRAATPVGGVVSIHSDPALCQPPEPSRADFLEI